MVEIEARCLNSLARRPARFSIAVLAEFSTFPCILTLLQPTHLLQLASPSDTLTFAVHDNNGNWDNNGTKNYIISKTGTYRLSEGELAMLPQALPVLVVRRQSDALA